MYLRPFEVQGSTVNATVTATSTVLQINTFQIDSRPDNVTTLTGHIRAISYHSTKLSSAQLISMTT